MKLADVFLRVRAFMAPRRVERELDEELTFHIARETQKQLANGLSPAQARTRAFVRFGSVPLAADQCRDARGTAFVDALVRDVSYAFRTFRRAPLAAFTIVATIALGLGLVAAVFTIYNVFFLRVDAVHEPAELFAVVRSPHPGADSSVPFTRADSPRGLAAMENRGPRGRRGPRHRPAPRSRFYCRSHRRLQSRANRACCVFFGGVRL